MSEFSHEPSKREECGINILILAWLLTQYLNFLMWHCAFLTHVVPFTSISRILGLVLGRIYLKSYQKSIYWPFSNYRSNTFWASLIIGWQARGDCRAGPFSMSPFSNAISKWRLCWNLNESHSPLRLEMRRCETFVIFGWTLAPVNFALFQRCLKNIQIIQGVQGPRSKADLLMKTEVAAGKREVWVRKIARRRRAGRDSEYLGSWSWSGGW